MNNYTRTMLIHKIYYELLGRRADPDGIDAYYNFTENLEDLQKIRNSIMNSEEYNNYKLQNNTFLYKNNLKLPIKTIVPLNLFLTWNTLNLPKYMTKNVELLKQQNPEFKCYLFDDNMCRIFLIKNFSQDVVNAFESLNPGAYKADLWRYCILYSMGGIYLDIKYNCLNEFKLIYLTDKEYFVKDRPSGCVYNGLIVVKPQNQILLKCIKQIVENVNNNFYPNNNGYSDCLEISGPRCLGNFFSNNEINKLELYFNENIYFKDNIILTQYDEYRHEQFATCTNHNYCAFFDNKNVYK